MMKRLVVSFMFLVVLLPGNVFGQLDRSAEVSRIMAGLDSASIDQRIKSAKVITQSGLKDDGLYQKVASLLRAGYSKEYESELADEMSWMCKALAASGDPKYRELLDEVAANSPSIKVQGYARESSELIDTYAQRSQILNSTDGWDDDLNSEENKLVNMLKSGDLTLKRDAAKFIVRNLGNNEKVFDAAASALSSMSNNIQSDSQYIDTMAWLCKALAASGNTKYIELLEQVHSNTQSVKLQSYATKALKSLK